MHKRARYRHTHKTHTRRFYKLIFAAFAILLLVLLLNCKSWPFYMPQRLQNAGITFNSFQEAPYNWKYLTRTERDRLSYVVDDRVFSRFGIDVSEHQGHVDWYAVAADDVEFAFIRLGYRTTDRGTIKTDSMAKTNIAGAQAVNLDIGAYFFSQATTVQEAQEEAELALSILDGTTLNYPVVFDFEPAGIGNDRISTLDSSTRTEIAEAFCKKIEASGYEAMIYGNGHSFAGYDMQKLSSYRLWYASYGQVPSKNFSFSIWQYSHTGEVAGIEHPVDLNIDLSRVLEAQKKQ